MRLYRVQLSYVAHLFLLTSILFSFNQRVKAQCTASIGALKTTNVQSEDGAFVCDGEALELSVDDYAAMEGQELQYVLHNDEDILKSDILAISSTGIFRNLGLFPKTKLYTTAMVLQSDAFSLNEDSCAVFSNTLVVHFLEPVIIHVDVECFSHDNYSIKIKIDGGLPEIIDTSAYTIKGTINEEIEKNQTIELNENFFDSHQFEINLEVSDTLDCLQSYKRSYNCGPAPVELVSFSGLSTKSGNMLKWVMATQIKTAYFLLEVTRDSLGLEVLDSIKGAGTTSNTEAYQYLHKVKIPGDYTYHLSKIDFDKNIEYCGKVAIKRFSETLFPNPTNQFINLHIDQQVNNSKVSIIDVRGKTVLTFDDSEPLSNQGLFKFDVSALANGIYFLHFQADELENIHKFIVHRK